MMKKAYLQNEYNLYTHLPHNINKWMKSIQDIYAKAHDMGFTNAFNQVTLNWDIMEKQDFKKWVSFYQEDAHNKYKTAQLAPSNYIENGGSFIPNINHLKAKLPGREPDMGNFVVSKDINDIQEKEMQKFLIEKKIQSLIGRLNSAEKIATNPQVQLALKKCLQMSVDEWVSLLQKLKREIQLAPMRFTTASLIEDIIYKNANQVYANGNKNAAKLLIKVAQIAPSTSLPVSSIDGMPPSPAGVPGPAQPIAPIDSTSVNSNNNMIGAPDDKDAMAEFLENINNIDILKIEDKEDGNEQDDEAEIIVTAQAAPAAPAALAGANNLNQPINSTQLTEPKPNTQNNIQTKLPEQKEELEVSEDEMQSNLAITQDPFDLALSNVKVKDIVARLEGIASMFKNRQIARQLSIIDLMMDKVGIAPFFPGLGEAMKSALESNQYCQTRVEEILAKLRGTITTPMSQHLEGEVSGENDIKEEQIKSQLAKKEQEEQARKERRKMIQEKEENEALIPQPSPGEQLTGPSQVQTAPPLRPTG